jgi:hypothetical protein
MTLFDHEAIEAAAMAICMQDGHWPEQDLGMGKLRWTLYKKHAEVALTTAEASLRVRGILFDDELAERHQFEIDARDNIINSYKMLLADERAEVERLKQQLEAARNNALDGNELVPALYGNQLTPKPQGNK